MGVAAGPNIVEDGLVLALDAGNVKSNSEISFNKWNNVIADATTVSSVGVITCLSIDTGGSSFFGVKYTNCTSVSAAWDNRPPSVSDMNTILETFLDCKSYQTGTYNHAGAVFGAYGNAGNICTLRFTGFGVGAVIGVGGYFNATTRQCRLTGDLVNSPLTITSPSGGFADPIVLTSDPADIQFANPGSNGDPMYVYWLGPYNQVPYVVRDNPGYIINGATYSSDDGGALVFDGTDDRVTVSSIPLMSQVTVEWWGTSDYPNSQYHVPVISTSSSSWTNGFGFYQLNGYVYWFVNTYTNYTRIPATSFGFTHWVGTYDLNNMKLYRNGSLVNTVAYTNAMNHSSTTLQIASQGSQYLWDGKISNVKTYNKALTEDEVQQNYNATKGRYGL